MVIQLLLANKVNDITILPTRAALTVAQKHMTEGLCPSEFCPTSAAVLFESLSSFNFFHFIAHKAQLIVLITYLQTRLW